nr:MAG TPA: hypothetical protein [Caudoviricetes sp.]
MKPGTICIFVSKITSDTYTLIGNYKLLAFNKSYIEDLR